jgi:hypothetical protein
VYATPSYVTAMGSKKGPLALYCVFAQLLLPGGSPQICSCAGQLLGPVCAYLQRIGAREGRAMCVMCEGKGAARWIPLQRSQAGWPTSKRPLCAPARHSAGCSDVPAMRKGQEGQAGHRSGEGGTLCSLAGSRTHVDHLQNVARRRENDTSDWILLCAGNGGCGLAK